MSEQQLRFFLLNELKTIRIVCRHPRCGAKTEIPLDQLRMMREKNQCPFCNRRFISERGENSPVAFELFVDAIKVLTSEEFFQIEFVVPGKDESAIQN